MFRREFYINFFYNHILCIDMVNESIKDLITRNGGNKKIIASKLGISPQFLGQLERGERKKPSAELVAKIKEVYNLDILTGKDVVQVNEATVSYGKEKASDLERLVSAFDSAVQAFTKALDSKERQVVGLENDKQLLENDKTWLKNHIDTLTMNFNSLKQA